MDFKAQVLENELHREGRCIYLDKIWRCEELAAVVLARLLQRPSMPSAVVPETLRAL